MTSFFQKDPPLSQLIQRLEAIELSPQETASAIVRLGKSESRSAIQAAIPVVTRYADSPDAWTRHEVMWFVAWCNLRNQSMLLESAITADPEPDNRGYAAICLGRLWNGSRFGAIRRVLCGVLRDSREQDSVRAAAYAGLLDVMSHEASYRPVDFAKGTAGFAHIEWSWVDRVCNE
jgi:hypothetical protein